MYENDQRKKIDTLGDIDNKTPTHMAVTYAISKGNFKEKFSKSNSQGNEQKLLYPKNQHDSLNQLQFLDIKNRPYKKLHRFLIPEFNLAINKVISNDSWE